MSILNFFPDFSREKNQISVGKSVPQIFFNIEDFGIFEFKPQKRGV